MYDKQIKNCHDFQSLGQSLITDMLTVTNVAVYNHTI